MDTFVQGIQSRNNARGPFLCILAGCAGLAAASVASADMIVPGNPTARIIRITATNAQGTATFLRFVSDGTFNANGQLNYTLPAAIVLTDIGSGNPIAVLNQLNIGIRPQIITGTGTVLRNQLSLGFNVTSGLSDTEFTIDTALFDIVPNFSHAGRMSGGITLTDDNGNGGTLTGLHSDGSSYWTSYNGAAPGGTGFASGISGVSVAAGAGSNSASVNIPGGGASTPLAGAPALNMSAEWHFRLSTGDSSGATSVWEIIPTPGAASLFGVGALMMLRRNRK